MAKRRKKRRKGKGKSQSSSIPHQVTPQATGPDGGDQQTSRTNQNDAVAYRFIEQSSGLFFALFVVLFLGYLWLFYSAPFTHDAEGNPISRFEFQRLLFVDMPDFLRLWTNEDIASCNLIDRLPILFATSLIVGLGAVIGCGILRLLRVDEGFSRLESFVFSTGIGMSVLSLMTLVLGLTIGFHQRIVCLAVFLGAGIVSLVIWIRQRTVQNVEADNVAPARRDRRDWLGCGAMWLILPFATVILLGAMLPPRSFDVREYHLQVPKEWYQNGHIGFLEHNIYGNMPMGAEMHAIVGMLAMDDWWLGALVGKTVIASFSILTAFLLFAMGRRFVNTTAGVVAAVVYISIPWVSLVSMHGLIEGVFGFYFAAAIFSFLIWIRGDGNSPKSGLVMLSGFLAGSALACKYPAILFVVAPILLCVMFLSKMWLTDSKPDQSRMMRWKAAAVFLVAVACASGLWLGKNWILTGNPTYPLLYEVFGGRSLTPETAEQWRAAHAVPHDENGRSFSIDLLAASSTAVLWKSQLLSPLLISLAGLSLIVKKHNRLVVFLLAFFVFVIALWWLLTHRNDRFWVPVLPIVALMAGIGVTWTSARVWQHAIVAVLFWGCFCNLQVMASKAMHDVRFFVSLEALRRDLPRKDAPIPTRIHRAHRAMNKHVPAGRQVLMVGNAEPFDLEVSVLYNTCFDQCIFTKLLKGKSKTQRIKALRDEKVAYIFVDWIELDRHRQAGGYGYSSDFPSIDTLKKLVRQGVLRKPTPPFVKDSEPRPGWQIFPVSQVIATD